MANPSIQVFPTKVHVPRQESADQGSIPESGTLSDRNGTEASPSGVTTERVNSMYPIR
jgi:hypothetical protein